MTSTLRVLTMNIWNFSEPYAARMALLRGGLETLAPDLMTFQEAGFHGGRHQVAEMLDGLGYHVLHQFEVSPPPIGDNGCCVASRWPLRLVELLPFTVTDRARRYPYAALAVRIGAPDPLGALLVISAKPSWELKHEHERELQAVALAQLVARHADPAGFPPVIGGDFDAAPDSASIRFLTGKQSLAGTSVHFRDAWAEAGSGDGDTWTSDNPYAAQLIDRVLCQSRHARRIDYIFVGSFHEYTRYARITHCRLELDKPRDGVWPSDHAAVYAEIAY